VDQSGGGGDGGGGINARDSRAFARLSALLLLAEQLPR
jgi:hypothetical protein